MKCLLYIHSYLHLGGENMFNILIVEDDKDLKDEDIYRINEKIKDLEKQVLNVIEG